MGSVLRPLGQPGDLGWVLMAHGEVYSAEYGWDSSFEATVAQIVGDFAAGHDPDREAGWIAEVDGSRAGCVLCVRKDDTTAALRVLLVDPAARGQRLGARLVDGCVEFARRAGYRRMTLWTNDRLKAAGRIYLDRGFRLVSAQPANMFGDDVTEQVYELDLA
jgi:GNAT superfamily N-acetyltransferase